MNLKFGFFDVDKTILDGDSMFDLLSYTWKKHPISFIPSIFNIGVSGIKYLFTGGKDVRIAKEGVFYIIKYLSDEEIEDFSINILLKKRAFKDALNEIEKLVSEKFTVVLVSASPYEYLKYFKKPLNVHKIMGTDIDKNGKIIGENCKHNEKVRKINQWLKSENYTIDYENSVGYSDSYDADAPMLELVKNRYLINSKLKINGYENLSWK